MKIRLNIDVLYRLMREREIVTIRQLSRMSGTTEETLYSSIRKQTLSKESYWKLAKFFGCHIEDLQVAYYSEKDCT